MTVAADRGWQSSGLRLTAGESYQLIGSGRYQVANPTGKKPWLSEPDGVTIRYYYKRPIGVLLWAVLPDDLTVAKESPLTKPQVVGSGATIVPTESGTLYLRINDSSARLSDNAAAATVRVTHKQPSN